MYNKNRALKLIMFLLILFYLGFLTTQGVGAELPAMPSSQYQSPVEVFFNKFEDKKYTQFGYKIFRTALPPRIPVVGPEYLLGPGDEISIKVWGQVLLQLRSANEKNSSLLEHNLIVDQKGHLLLPELGPISISGLSLGNLEGVLTTKYRELYKDCLVAIALTNIRKIEVLVSGQVENPGYVSVQAGSTVYEALLAAGGITKMGSLRNVMLRQADNKTQQIDLYRLIVTQDEVPLLQLREKDILSVPHIGSTVLIKGEVRHPGIYELIGGENLNDLVGYAGEAFPNTNLDQIEISRFNNAGSRQIMHIKGLNTITEFQDGDVVNLTDLTLRVTTQGAVHYPGDYPIGKDTRLVDVLKDAGGLIPEAYLPGLVLIRPNAWEVQTAYRQVAVELLKKDLVWQSAESAQKYLSEEEKNEKKQAVAIIQSYLSHIESQAPEGRIVLASDSLVSLEKFEQSCCNVTLKNGDRIFVPTTPDFISIVGEIYRPSSYLFQPKKKLAYYLALAGGISPYADLSASFLVRSSGEIMSYQQKQKHFLQMVMEPGDVVVLPSKVLRIKAGI